MIRNMPPVAASVLAELDEAQGARQATPGLQLVDPTTLSSHPSDSSRVLLGLMALSHKARTHRAAENEFLDGVINAGVLRSLLSALNYRDAATLQHVRRTAGIATALARFLGWDGRHLKTLEVAALLHDMGKIGVPDNVLFKPSELSPNESELMSLHYNIGIDVLQACRVDPQVLEFVGNTHIFLGAASEGICNVSDIPMGSRILTIADAYDSLRSDQTYRTGRSHNEAMQILSHKSGTQFDGNILSALTRCYEKHGEPVYAPGTGGASTGPTQLGPVEALEASTLCHIFNHLYLLESLYDGFYLIDSDMKVVVWNRGLETLLGYSASEMLNRTWTDRELSFTDQNDVPLRDDQLPLQRLLATGRTVTASVRALDRLGNRKDIELQTVPLLDGEQRLYGVAGMIRDLTRTHRRPQEFRELRLAATRDPLTLVANRGELETQLEMQVVEQTKSQDCEPLSVIFVDVDHFKSINDSFGHTVGDNVLIELARLMQKEMYSGELVGRYGGEEFVILCPETDLDAAVAKAERLRIAITKIQVEYLVGREITASFGIAQYEPGDTVQSLLRRADEALYLSKNRGRNRTSSLTVQQLEVEQSSAEADKNSDPFVFETTFKALVAHDMIVFKLGGFVTDHDARLTKIQPDQIVMHIGHLGLFRRWGRDEDSKAVELTVNLRKNAPRQNQKAASIQTEVGVQIRPLGSVRDPDVFQNRAKSIFRELRAFFVAEFTHT